MDERIGQTVTVDGAAYRILRLLGKGKGGYSYLAKAPGGEQVLDRVSLQVKAGGLIAVTGPNGSGKSTLLKIIAGLERPAGGEILLEGEDISSLDVPGPKRVCALPFSSRCGLRASP